MAKKAITKSKSIPVKDATTTDEGFADDGSSSASDGPAQALLKSFTRRTNEFDNINVVVRVKPSVMCSKNNPESSPGTGTGNNRRSHSHPRESANPQQAPDDLFPAAGQIQISDPTSGLIRSFTFDVIFEPEASQEQVFEHSRLKKFIDMALEGFASTVFAYGQTGSGKTFTMTGNVFTERNNNKYNNSGENEAISSSTLLNSSSNGGGGTSPVNGQIEHVASNSSSRRESLKRKSRSGSGKDVHTEEVVGLTQFTFAYLWEQIRARTNDVTYVVTTSFLEVYNEHVFDLLNPAPKSLQVRWSKDRGFYAENLFKVECEDLNDLEGVLKEGLKNRSVRAHEMNATSSRSHSLLTINLSSETKDPEDPNGYIKREGKICLVDLAGSEKTKRTGSKGETFIEANNINKSLLVLGNCISSLSSGRTSHIPYRDSILTKLLADSLSGSGMTLMIACVSALPQDAHETIQTLRYASRAKKVKTNPIVRMDPRELAILSLKREVRLLRMENNYLRQQLNLGNGTEHPPMSDSPPVQAELTKFPNHRPSLTTVDPNLFQQYMSENENLRLENQALMTEKDRLLRYQEQADRTILRLQKSSDTNDTCSPDSKDIESPSPTNVDEGECIKSTVPKVEGKTLYKKNMSKSIGNLARTSPDEAKDVSVNETKPVIKSHNVPIPVRGRSKEDSRRPSIVTGWESNQANGGKEVNGKGNNNLGLEVKGSNAISSRGRSLFRPRR